MQLEWEPVPPRSRPTTFLFRGQERASGKIREGMIAATTKWSARRALRRDGLKVSRLEQA